MFSQTFRVFSSVIVDNIKSFNRSTNIKSLSIKKTLSHFEHVKSFEEVARLTVNNWLGSALLWDAARLVGWGREGHEGRLGRARTCVR
jgi:ABC-type transporter lipoprotein component MlaA